jgi:hypothetical protein
MAATSGGKKSKGAGGLQIREALESLTGKLRTQFNAQAGKAGGKAKVQTAELAVKLARVQRAALAKGFKVLAQVQERGEKAIKDHLDDATWLPGEGKDIVREWSRTLNDGRDEFRKTVDKSYELLGSYLERVEKEQKKGAAKAKPAVKKPQAAKKKVAAKKKRPA